MLKVHSTSVHRESGFPEKMADEVWPLVARRRAGQVIRVKISGGELLDDLGILRTKSSGSPTQRSCSACAALLSLESASGEAVLGARGLAELEQQLRPCK
jgi:hypothetical protein